MKRLNAVNVNVSNMSLSLEVKAIKSADMLLRFYASDFLKSRLLNLDRKTLKGESKSSIVWKLTNEELYEHFMSGKEESSDDVDYEADLTLSRYRKMWSKVIGYIIPMKPIIYVNAKFFDVMSVIKVACNMVHEWGHMMGLRHSGKYFRESLAYYLGTWANEFLHNNSTPVDNIPKRKTVCYRSWKTFFMKRCYTKVVKG